MAYNLIITERADELLDSLVDYLLIKFDNKQAAAHLLDKVDLIIDRIEINPYQFPECKEEYLSEQGFREAHLVDMRYVIVYYIQDDSIIVSGIYHELELYSNKIEL